MRHLFLLRHAQAANPAGCEDKHRPLTPQGMADAQALGQLMKAKHYIPDFIACSPARRTQQTMRKVTEALGPIPSASPQSLYFSTAGQLYESLKTLNNNHKKVLLISHNPSIHGLARFLIGLGGEEAVQRLNHEYRECTLSFLECSIDDWADLAPAQNDLADLLVPGRDFVGVI